MAFKVGDVVWLKSGGAAMTVSVINGQGTIFTLWHNRSDEGFKEVSGSGYNEAMLTTDNPNKKSGSAASVSGVAGSY